MWSIDVSSVSMEMVMMFRSMTVCLMGIILFCGAGCEGDPCGAHQHEYFERCVCDLNYMLVGDACIPIPEKQGWCPGDLVCTQLANNYMACANADGTLPGDPTVECPEFPVSSSNSSWVDLNEESVCILHCGECSSGECVYVGYGYKYSCADVRGESFYLPHDVNSCFENSDCRANRSCRVLGNGSTQQFCIEHCSIPMIEDGDLDTD